MNRLTKIFLLTINTLFYSCGTGPWFIQKDLYGVYKEPVYQNTDILLRTDGFYAHLDDSKKVDLTRKVLLLTKNGYTLMITYDELKKSIASQDPVFKELDWWKVKKDSIIIEHYGETKKLIKTNVWWYKGKVLNDSIIEIAYEDGIYTRKPVKYKFVRLDTLPKLKNNTRYYKKDWYHANLHRSRQ
ncbi:hypothetical protein [Sungkyunkwania multivorans]